MKHVDKNSKTIKEGVKWLFAISAIVIELLLIDLFQYLDWFFPIIVLFIIGIVGPLFIKSTDNKDSLTLKQITSGILIGTISTIITIIIYVCCQLRHGI